MATTAEEPTGDQMRDLMPEGAALDVNAIAVGGTDVATKERAGEIAAERGVRAAAEDEDVAAEAKRQLEAEHAETWPHGWNKDLDAALYKQIKEISEVISRMSHDARAVESLRQTHKMLQELMRELGIEEGERFKNPDQAVAALAAIYTHELAVAHAFGVQVTNGGQKEGEVVLPAVTEVEKDIVIKEGTPGGKRKGLISPKLIGLLERTGAKIGGFEGWYRSIFELTPEEKLTLKISLPQTGEKIVHPYAAKWGIEGKTSQQVLEHLQHLEDLRSDVFERLGLDPQNEHHLAIMSLNADTPGDITFLQEVFEQRKRLLEGKDPANLSGVERLEVEFAAFDAAAENTCEWLAKRVRETEIKKEEPTRAAQRARIEENIRNLESGKARIEDVEDQIDNLTKDIEGRKRELSRLENYVGRIKDDGSREEGLLKKAKDEYRETNDNKDKAETKYRGLESDCDLTDANSRIRVIGAEKTRLNGERGTQTTVMQTALTEIARQKGEIAGQTANLAAETNPTAQATIRSAIAALNAQMAEQQANYTIGKDLAGELRDDLKKLEEEEKKLSSDLREAKAEYEAVDRIFGRKKKSANVILAEFNQELGGTGTREDNAAKRDDHIQTKKNELGDLEKQLASLDKQKEGEATPEDKQKAERMRAILALMETEIYCKLVGDVEAGLIAKMTDPRTSLKAIHEAVFNHTGYETTVEEGKPVRKKYLTDEEKAELLTRGEVVLLALESQGIRLDEILEGPHLTRFNNRLQTIRNIETQIADLEQNKPPHWQTERDDLNKNKRDELKKNQILLSNQYEKVLHYLSRNEGAAREFTRHTIKYLAEKAESGQLEAVAHALLEEKAAEEVYEFKRAPKTEYGHAELHPKSPWPRLAELGKPVYRGETISYTLRTEDKVNILVTSQKRKKGKAVFSAVEVRKDNYLYNMLPGNVAGAVAAGLSPDIIRIAYDPTTTNKVAVEDFADNQFVVVGQMEQPDFDQTLTALGALGLPAAIDKMYPAAVTKMVQDMGGEDREEILRHFNTISYSVFNKDYNIAAENGRLVIIGPMGPGLPDRKQQLADFVKDYEKNLREFLAFTGAIPSVDAPLSTVQLRAMENNARELYMNVGTQLLKAIQRKS